MDSSIYFTPEHETGWRSSDTAELHFDGCRIPAENLLGVEHEGFRSFHGGATEVMLDEAAKRH